MAIFSPLKFKFDFKFFFNTIRLEGAVRRKERKILFSTGGYGRKVIKSTIRPSAKSRRGKTSPPGTPPYGHTGKLRKSTLFQVYMHNRRDVVIGPRKFERSRSIVPKLLEFGGTAMGPRRGLATFRHGVRLTKGSKTVRYRYRARPFVFRNMRATQDAMRRFTKEFELK